MKSVNPDFNFSIVLPGKCNASCGFCFWEYNKPTYNVNYIDEVKKILSVIKPHQVSISGGEPTISPYFDDVLQLLRDTPSVKKVVLTTNGANLINKIDIITGIVNHVNISRHRADDEQNYKIFNTNSVPCIDKLTTISTMLEKAGIDLNINAVYSENNDISIFEDLIYLVKHINGRSLTIRNDYNIKDWKALNAFENHIIDYKVIKSGSCPVCITRYRLYKGVEIRFKYSELNPNESKSYEYDIYEYVLQPDGKLYNDWNYKNPIILHSINKNKRIITHRNIQNCIVDVPNCNITSSSCR